MSELLFICFDCLLCVVCLSQHNTAIGKDVVDLCSLCIIVVLFILFVCCALLASCWRDLTKASCAMAKSLFGRTSHALNSTQFLSNDLS